MHDLRRGEEVVFCNRRQREQPSRRPRRRRFTQNPSTLDGPVATDFSPSPCWEQATVRSAFAGFD